MSSGHVVDSSSILRAKIIADKLRVHEKQTNALQDAEGKHAAVMEAKDGDIDMTDAVAQAGRQLARGVVEKRLRELNSNLYFQRSVTCPNKSGVYRNGVFLTWMEWDRSPEFTVNFIGEDERGRKELLEQIRGWRALLDILIRKQVIEAESAYKLFEVFRGRESKNWSTLHT